MFLKVKLDGDPVLRKTMKLGCGKFNDAG